MAQTKEVSKRVVRDNKVKTIPMKTEEVTKDAEEIFVSDVKPTWIEWQKDVVISTHGHA
jgi:hypothetical protein